VKAELFARTRQEVGQDLIDLRRSFEETAVGTDDEVGPSRLVFGW
jgi:hypothetical protein